MAEVSYPHSREYHRVYCPDAGYRKPIKIIKKRIGIIVSNDASTSALYICAGLLSLLFGLRGNDDFICHAGLLPDRSRHCENWASIVWIFRRYNQRAAECALATLRLLLSRSLIAREALHETDLAFTET